ncbi:hypothetical protein Tco_1093140 [Tanacetum coccineum]|uniref:Uncharacterized protein n=1 Tax=Tanacetum coccineum TaxID=301880 RepID=A0ABQ5IBU0_9ASTR
MIKVKGKAIIIEPKVPMKRKDQVALDEDLVRNLQAQLEDELIEEERLVRKQEEEANIDLIELWDNIKAMMESDFKKKHFAMLRAKEKRRKPPTKAQKRNLMSTYLKTMAKKEIEESSKGTEDELKSDKSNKAESSEEKAKGIRKKILGKIKEAVKEQNNKIYFKVTKEWKMIKRLYTHEEVEVDDEAELKKHLVIVKDNDIEIDAIPLAMKPLVIIEYKLLKQGILVHYQLIRADRSSKRYSSMIRMLQDIDREDSETL